MMNATEATAAQNALPYPLRRDFPTQDSYEVARSAYHEEVGRVNGEFRDCMAATYASEFPEEVQDLIFGKAWEDGHSGGYHEIEGHYIDYAEFAEKLRLLFQR